VLGFFAPLPRDTAGKRETATPTESFHLAPDSGGHYTESMGLNWVRIEESF
jgi:hypothetical protein